MNNSDSKENEIITLKEELKALYKRLLEEQKGPYGTNFMPRDPSPDTYVLLAKNLINKASAICKHDQNFCNLQELGSIKNEEIELVKWHELKYEKDGRLTPSNRRKLDSLMQDATEHLRNALLPLLKDIG